MAGNDGMRFPDQPYAGGFQSTSSVEFRWQVINLRQGHSFEAVWRGLCGRCERNVWIARDGRWYDQLSRYQGTVLMHEKYGGLLMCCNCIGEPSYVDSWIKDIETEGSNEHSRAELGQYAPYVWKKIDSPTKKEKAA